MVAHTLIPALRRFKQDWKLEASLSHTASTRNIRQAQYGRHRTIWYKGVELL